MIYTKIPTHVFPLHRLRPWHSVIWNPNPTKARTEWVLQPCHRSYITTYTPNIPMNTTDRYSLIVMHISMELIKNTIKIESSNRSCIILRTTNCSIQQHFRRLSIFLKIWCKFSNNLFTIYDWCFHFYFQRFIVQVIWIYILTYCGDGNPPSMFTYTCKRKKSICPHHVYFILFTIDILHFFNIEKIVTKKNGHEF